MKRLFLLLLLLPFAADAKILLSGGGVGSSTISITSVTCTPTNFTANIANAIVCPVSVTMNTGNFAGTLSISGSDANTNFVLSNNNITQLGPSFSHVYNNSNCTAGQNYRPDFTNFNSINDSGALLDVGCFATVGDSLPYTININQPGPYILNVRAGTPNTGASWTVLIDCVPVATVSFTPTGGYGVFQTFQSTQFTTTQGTHQLALQCLTLDTGGRCGDIVYIQGQVAATDSTVLPAPPNGFHWVRTFDDEFNATTGSCGNNCLNLPLSINTVGGVWEIYRYCGNANFPGDYNPPLFGCNFAGAAAENIAGSNLLSMTYDPNSPGGGTSQGNIQDTAAIVGNPGPGFYQRYGFFVYDAQLPQNPGVQEVDLEMFPQGQYTNPMQVGYPNSGYGELNFYMPPNSNNPTQVSWQIRDPGLNNGSAVPNTPGGSLSTSFHQYGFYWKNDGSPHGTVTAYFDGNLQTGSYTIQSSAWDLGMYFDIFGGGQSSGDALKFHWVRAYQLVAN